MIRFRHRATVAVGTLVVLGSAVAPAAVAHPEGPIARHVNAAAAKKVPLGAVNATATATGIRAPLYSHQGEDVEAEVPYAVSELGGGGVAHAVTTIVWPGATGAHGGSTLGVLGLNGIPPSLENSLNDPEIAEAPTVSGATTSDKSTPAFTMKAVAKPTDVEATSSFGPASTSSTVGTIKTTTTIKQTKDQAVIDATSELTNVSIGGVLTIGSVISSAHATTNGKTSTGTTETEIAGAKVAGINVTIDQNGISLSGKGLLPPLILNTLNKTVNTALKSVGLTIVTTQGTKKIKGPSVNLTAGDLIIGLSQGSYKTQANDTGVLLQLGGASITAIASPGYVAPKITTKISPAPAASTGTNNIGTPTSTGGSAPLPPSGGGSTTAPTDTGAAPIVATKSALNLPGVIGWGWVVLALALTGFIAFGLKRLPDEVLKPSGAACNIEEGT